MTALFFALVACGGPEPLPTWGEVPAFALTDQAGVARTHESLRGKAWVADFIFTTCPDVCPVLSARMAQLQARYAKDDRVRLVSFSVDPATDTPPVLAEYGGRFGADAARWWFLTGDVAAVKAVVVDGFKQLMEAVPATETEPATVLHGSRFVLVDAAGNIRGYPDPDVPGEIEGLVDRLLGE